MPITLRDSCSDKTNACKKTSLRLHLGGSTQTAAVLQVSTAQHGTDRRTLSEGYDLLIHSAGTLPSYMDDPSSSSSLDIRTRPCMEDNQRSSMLRMKCRGLERASDSSMLRSRPCGCKCRGTLKWKRGGRKGGEAQQHCFRTDLECFLQGC